MDIFDKLLKKSRNSINNKNFLDKVPKNIDKHLKDMNNLKKELVKNRTRYGSYKEIDKDKTKRELKLISLGNNKKTISKLGVLTKMFGNVGVGRPEKNILIPKLNMSKKLLFEKLRKKLKEQKECPKDKVFNPKTGRCIKQRKL